MVDNLLPEHVELLHVLDLAVHLVQLTTWMGRGGHGTYGILVSPQSQLDFGFFTSLGLGLGLGLGGQGLGLGLDKKTKYLRLRRYDD